MSAACAAAWAEGEKSYTKKIDYFADKLLEAMINQKD